MDGNVTKIEITLDNGRKLMFLPRYKAKNEKDVDFLFNGADDVSVSLNMGAMVSAGENQVAKDRRKATLNIECVIATDRIIVE